MRKWITYTLLAMGLFAVAPPPAAAVDGTFYEVSETMRLRGGKITRRTATASLVGTIKGGSEICPTPTPCNVIISASDRVDLASGKGPVHGSFAIVVQDTNTVDGPEVPIFEGTLVGDVDLASALTGVAPLGSIVGTWTGRGLDGGPLAKMRTNGTFTGTFRFPFVFNGVPSYMVGVGNVVPVADTERSTGTPLVRLDISLQF